MDRHQGSAILRLDGQPAAEITVRWQGRWESGSRRLYGWGGTVVDGIDLFILDGT